LHVAWARTALWAPAGQSAHADAPSAPFVLLPMSHCRQLMLLGSGACFPAAHAAHPVLLRLVLNRPAAHAWHSSWNAVGALPAAHSLQSS
jgi:hypothetical protein